MSDFLATVCLLVILGLAIFGYVQIGAKVDKWECEKDLPRNVECTWQAPREGDQ